MQCEKVLEGLLRDGRLTLKQMIDRASQGASQENGKCFIWLTIVCREYCISSFFSSRICFKIMNPLKFVQLKNHAFSLSDSAVVADAVRENLCKLLMARYVERCPAAEVTIVEEEIITKKRGAKSDQVTVHLCQFLYVVP